MSDVPNKATVSESVTYHSNPFATRFISPAASRYVFYDGMTEDELIERLRANRWHGQIVGPHGTGKTTLLKTLMPILAEWRRQPVFIPLRDGQRRFDASADQRSEWNAATQLMVDGYEQLGASFRWRLHRWCRQAGCGLLITSHRQQRWPMLYRTSTNPAMFADIVARLMTNVTAELRPTAEQVRRAYERHGGNLREALFELYDVFERSRRTTGAI